MRYIIIILGLAIIGLRTCGITIDTISIGLFVFISLIALLKDSSQLSEFSGFGFKIKFNNDLKKLSQQTEKLGQLLEVKIKKEQGVKEIKEEEDSEYFNFIGDYSPDHFEYMDESFARFQKPKIALIEVASEIEITLRYIAKRILEKDNKIPFSVLKILNGLYKEKLINKDLFNTYKTFWDFRNRIIHNVRIKYTENQIISLVDSGKRLSEILRIIKNNVYKGLNVKSLS